MRKYGYILFFILIAHQIVFPLTLDRVILATNNNPDYIQFWPIAAKAWKEVVGIRPTLALIGCSGEVTVDESYGDVIRFAPIDGIPTSFYAQCVRLLLPCLFPNDGCILADIDLIPLQKRFFLKKIEKIPEDRFVIYRNKAYWFNKSRIYMCYNVAKGATFQEIFDIQSIDDIPQVIKEWWQIGLGWDTDEKVLYRYLKKWINYKTRVKKLGYGKRLNRRIERKLAFRQKKVFRYSYIEMNCPRPYIAHKHQIDHIMNLAFLAAKIKEG
jgi:hypothetical protein